MTDQLAVQVQVQGNIYDASGGILRMVTLRIIDPYNGEPISEPFTVEAGSYQAWTDRSPYEVAVLFTKKGYEDKTVTVADLVKQPNIVMNESGTRALSYAALLVLVYFAVKSYKKKTGKVGALGTNDLLPIFLAVGGIVGFKLIEQLLQTLGLWKTQETKALDQMSSDPTSFWNPEMWRAIPAGKDYSYALTESQAGTIADQIYNSFGAFNDDEEVSINAFKSLHTQANASFIAWKFAKSYGYDLLTFLRGGSWPQDRLSDQDVYTINSFVTKLPKY